MIKIGDKLRLKYDITVNGTTNDEKFGPKILGYRNSIVDVIGYDNQTNIYLVEDEKCNKMNVRSHEVHELFVIPTFEQLLPYEPGWYLYKTECDINPTYCKLQIINGKLCIESGDIGYPIDKMSNFLWLKVY